MLADHYGLLEPFDVQLEDELLFDKEEFGLLCLASIEDKVDLVVVFFLDDDPLPRVGRLQKERRSPRFYPLFSVQRPVLKPDAELKRLECLDIDDMEEANDNTFLQLRACRSVGGPEGDACYR